MGLTFHPLTGPYGAHLEPPVTTDTFAPQLPKGWHVNDPTDADDRIVASDDGACYVGITSDGTVYVNDPEWDYMRGPTDNRPEFRLQYGLPQAVAYVVARWGMV